MPRGSHRGRTHTDWKAGYPGFRRTKKSCRTTHAEQMEKDADEEESVNNEVGNTEEREDAGTNVLATGEKENSNTRALDPGDDIRTGEGDSGKQQLCHVPGVAWFQPVRSCLKTRLSAIVGREEGGEGEQGEAGKGYLGKWTQKGGSTSY
ncbi:hypothetical protein NDU88_003917 [Pleurodeles waltl]|uniref:Uncharacterized protein n=1 Tax=Pleurodeles waltl TaxID=8319 RepID=A0AAV7UE82_PLEWA|nr:hypothetical protein NDU88_003917 [Pleurodeles waltl]